MTEVAGDDKDRIVACKIGSQETAIEDFLIIIYRSDQYGYDLNVVTERCQQADQ